MTSFANRSLSAAALLLSMGCASSSGPLAEGVPCNPSREPAVGDQSVLPNGYRTNGTNLNGTNLNGTNLNGRSLNGTTLNGTDLNGATLQGARLSGTELTGVSSDGRAVAGADTVGATLTGVLTDGSTIALTIAGYAKESGVAYYTLAASGQPVCPDGGRGIFVPGAWDATGARHDALAVGSHTVDASYSCLDGAIAKCVMWGYEPSKVGADLHQSCTRMVRADYCGSGVSFTKEGTLIDVFDTRGVQQPTAGDPSLVFEAAWTTTGAACVNRTRYDATTPSGEAVLPSCWGGLPRCASWTDATAQGALLGNASRVAPPPICPGP
jgi:uncharacterized protein YjbI with pentapeptide repeats